MDQANGHWKYCPRCGSRLMALQRRQDVWVQPLQCSNDDCGQRYVDVLDERSIYPLQPVFPDIPEKLLTASADTVRAAWLRIKRVDYRTVSVDDFERTLLGVYDDRKEGT